MRKWIGVPESLVLVGLGALAVGLWMTVGWWSAVVCGALLMISGLFLAIRGV